MVYIIIAFYNLYSIYNLYNVDDCIVSALQKIARHFWRKKMSFSPKLGISFSNEQKNAHIERKLSLF